MIKETIYMMFGIVKTPAIVAAIFIPLLTICAPIAAIIHTMLILIIIDNITGIMKAFKHSGKSFNILKRESWMVIESKKLGNTLIKMLAYVLLIVAAFLIDTYIIQYGEAIFFTKVISASIAFREIISILENTEYISGRELLSLFINMIKNGFNQGLTNELDNRDKKEKNE